MSKQLNYLQSLIEKLSTRERILVLLGVLSVIYMLWNSFLMLPVQVLNKSLANERLSIQEQVAELQRRRIVANGLLQSTRRKKLINEIDLVQKKIKNFDIKILERLEGRVAPENMADMLSDVLQKNQGLELLSINNLPAEPLFHKEQEESLAMNKKSNSKTKISKKIDPELMGVFMHSLEMELQGRYLDILNYLVALEELPWKIFWDQVKLEVVEYPKVKVHIKVHTFSLKDGWLSV
ncbi:MAG: hypothetical protein QNL62_13065 [Gammaproteobacteria bacterium]|nr:hypothetical protein [Gammaproteobacteria bacterium]